MAHFTSVYLDINEKAALLSHEFASTPSQGTSSHTWVFENRALKLYKNSTDHLKTCF